MDKLFFKSTKREKKQKGKIAYMARLKIATEKR